MARYRVHEEAKAKGFDISKLSRKSDLNYNTVAGIWHNRTTRADLASLEKIAEVLKVPVSKLIEDEPSVKPKATLVGANY
jgi:transcriptional regulator with XRE-family HTH domain